VGRGQEIPQVRYSRGRMGLWPDCCRRLACASAHNISGHCVWCALPTLSLLMLLFHPWLQTFSSIPPHPPLLPGSLEAGSWVNLLLHFTTSPSVYMYPIALTCMSYIPRCPLPPKRIALSSAALLRNFDFRLIIFPYPDQGTD
jgi:hypothetical protein